MLFTASSVCLLGLVIADKCDFVGLIIIFVFICLIGTTYLYNAKYSSNSCIGYKLSFFRNHFYLDMESDLKLSVARLSVNRLDLTQQVTLDNILSTFEC